MVCILHKSTEMLAMTPYRDAQLGLVKSKSIWKMNIG
jgi:hypothetical protein